MLSIVKASKNRTPYILIDPCEILFPFVRVNLWVNQAICPIINVLDYSNIEKGIVGTKKYLGCTRIYVVPFGCGEIGACTKEVEK
uniref:Uncharacterized protein n=1 Tax=Candidatus Methanophaga sp. ANME-1 ERB7 TaxID=2759913 RepID=A0A7G9ZCR9_9EURY|nr:hypothetical protein BLAHKPKO_00017 [Methanosarcinales archaeon ANME-1 ERB7]